MTRFVCSASKLTFVLFVISALRWMCPGLVLLMRTWLVSYGLGLFPKSTSNEPSRSWRSASSRIIRRVHRRRFAWTVIVTVAVSK